MLKALNNKGKLLLVQQLQNDARSNAKFACEYDELEYDNLENQILLYSLHRCSSWTVSSSKRNEINRLIIGGYTLKKSILEEIPIRNMSTRFKNKNWITDLNMQNKSSKKDQNASKDTRINIFAFCPGCGFNNENKFKFCPQCGVTLTP